jgi:hypothetical protein
MAVLDDFFAHTAINSSRAVLDDFASHGDVKSSRTRRARIAASERTLPQCRS